ncbi:MAG: MarR family transcriptional regulator [Erysipelotrichaceae bacterium]
MAEAKKTLNELLVNLFNYILVIEEKNLKEQGIKLSMTEVHVLESIYNCRTKIMSEVAESLMVTRGTLSVGIDRLAKKGYVVREKDRYDGRVVHLKLTDLAYEVLQTHKQFHDEMIAHLTADMDIEDNSQLINTLDTALTYFKEKL